MQKELFVVQNEVMLEFERIMSNAISIIGKRNLSLRYLTLSFVIPVYSPHYYFTAPGGKARPFFAERTIQQAMKTFVAEITINNCCEFTTSREDLFIPKYRHADYFSLRPSFILT